MSSELDLKAEPDQPVVYQIRVKSHLGADWTDWFGGLAINLEEDGDTLLTGPVIDQAALYGLLKKVRDLGIPLVSVVRVEPAEAPPAEVKLCNPATSSEKEQIMNTDRNIRGAEEIKARLSTLWLFAILNYLYCDVVGLMDPGLLKQFITGTVGGMQINQGFLLGAAILMEIPISMVLLSRVLKYGANRWANIIAGAIMTVVQFSTLFFGSAPTTYYLFFSVIEITCTVLIVWNAWKWANPEPSLRNKNLIRQEELT